MQFPFTQPQNNVKQIQLSGMEDGGLRHNVTKHIVEKAKGELIS